MLSSVLVRGFSTACIPLSAIYCLEHKAVVWIYSRLMMHWNDDDVKLLCKCTSQRSANAVTQMAPVSSQGLSRRFFKELSAVPAGTILNGKYS